MGLVDWLRQHNKKNRQIRNELKSMLRHSEDVRLERIAPLLHHLCVEYAAAFVQYEQGRGEDSPFCELDKGRFFHELLLLNYWIADRVISDKERALIGEMKKQYLVSFHHLSDAEQNTDLSHIDERFAAYTETWEDKSGHKDFFAEAFARYLFNERKVERFNEILFWVITHAEDVTRNLKDFKTICNQLGIRTKAATGTNRHTTVQQ